MNSNSIKLRLDFEKNSTDPQRVFDSMSDLIQSVQTLHSCILNSVISEYETELLLSDVKEGSIISWLTPKIDAKDEILSEDKKKKINTLLNVSTQKIIKFIQGKDTISSSAEVDELEEQLRQDAIDLEEFPNVFSLDRQRLMNGLSSMGTATKHLHKNDSAYLELRNGPILINKNFSFSDNEIKALLSERIDKLSDTGTFVIKRADFLGNSMWDFIFEGKTISAKILDKEWINEFHHRKKSLYPGDGLRCRYTSYTSYDKQNAVVEQKYEILNIVRRVDTMISQGEIEFNE